VAASLLVLSAAHARPSGVALALVSGVVTSGIGYVLWYAALRHLSTAQASLLQLTVPALAAAAGVVFLEERWTTRLTMATALILGGVAVAVRRDRKSTDAGD
jgi:drug/metabolite transporter (DMT)-like permease